MVALKFSTLTAPSGQFLAQIPQPIQPARQSFMVIGPLSPELQAATYLAEYGMRVIRFLGHTETHFPQAMQASLSTCATPLQWST